MHTTLLNMGFRKLPDGSYVCEAFELKGESIVIQKDKFILMPMQMEISEDEIMQRILED